MRRPDRAALTRLRADLGIARPAPPPAPDPYFTETHGRYSDERAARMLEGVGVTRKVDGWTFEAVKAHLRDMAIGVERMGGKVGPADDTGFWPDPKLEFADLVNMAGTDSLEEWAREQNFVAPARDITRIEAALTWMMRYVDKERDPVEHRALALWLRCKAHRLSFRDEAWDLHRWSKSTAYDRRDRAIEIILAGLLRDREAA